MDCGSAFEAGASGLPYYCTPPVCVPDVLGALGVWRQNNKKKSCCKCRSICVDSNPKKKKVFQGTFPAGSMFRETVCASALVWSLPGGELPSKHRRRSIFFRVLFQQTNKQRNASASENMFAYSSTHFLGNSKSENPAFCEWFMLRLLDPPLLVRIYLTTPEHKNIYMIHGMRGYQKVAKSCNKIHVPQKYVCKYIYVYVSRSCALCPLLIHILLYHSCGILGTKHCVALSGYCWCAGTFPDCRSSTNPSDLRFHQRLFFCLLE